MKAPITMEYVIREEMADDIQKLVDQLVVWMAQDEFGNATIHWAQHKPKKIQRTETVLVN